MNRYIFKKGDQHFIFETDEKIMPDAVLGNRFREAIIVQDFNHICDVGIVCQPVTRFSKKIINYNKFWTKFNETEGVR